MTLHEAALAAANYHLRHAFRLPAGEAKVATLIAIVRQQRRLQSQLQEVSHG